MQVLLCGSVRSVVAPWALSSAQQYLWWIFKKSREDPISAVVARWGNMDTLPVVKCATYAGLNTDCKQMDISSHY